MKSELNTFKLARYIAGLFSRLGTKFLYYLLLMYYALRSSTTPRWAKNVIIGSLSYVLSPIDAIPDLTPVLGMTDDLGVLVVAISAIAAYIDSETRAKARKRLEKLLGKSMSAEEVEEVDDMINEKQYPG